MRSKAFRNLTTGLILLTAVIAACSQRAVHGQTLFQYATLAALLGGAFVRVANEGIKLFFKYRGNVIGGSRIELPWEPVS